MEKSLPSSPSRPLEAVCGQMWRSLDVGVHGMTVAVFRHAPTSLPLIIEHAESALHCTITYRGHQEHETGHNIEITCPCSDALVRLITDNIAAQLMREHNERLVRHPLDGWIDNTVPRRQGRPVPTDACLAAALLTLVAHRRIIIDDEAFSNEDVAIEHYVIPEDGESGEYVVRRLVRHDMAFAPSAFSDM